MTNLDWDRVSLGIGEEEPLWETFHENSKTEKFGGYLSNEVVFRYTQNLHDALPYDSLPSIALPTSLSPLTRSLSEAIVMRTTPAKMEPCPISREQLATLLFYAYGVTRDNQNTPFSRPFRTIPSGGGLFPLEIYFFTRGAVEGLETGIYHYHPVRHNLRFVKPGDWCLDIAKALVQPNIAEDCSILFFITAIFNRSTFKYKERGYRFVFLEAGHLAQNLNLVATAMDLGVWNVGGYFDRDIDRLLEVDGLNHSTIYLNAIGKKLDVRQSVETLRSIGKAVKIENNLGNNRQ